MTGLRIPAAEELYAGRYSIREPLGEGGMGRVYLAQDTLLEGEVVALKILEAQGRQAEKQVEAFLAAARLARRVVHRNVVRTFDAGLCGQQVFVSMEYAPGATVRSILEESGKVESGQAVFMLLQIASGLKAIHQTGTVHGDLKPCNIIMTPEGVVKISDLGIASSLAGAKLEDDELLGSWAYLAPELWSGHERSVASDIYSLGILAYEMLSGEVPFDGSSLPELMNKHLHQDPAALISRGADLPAWLERLVLSMLEKDPEKRPQTAGKIELLLHNSLEAGEIELPFVLPDEAAPASGCFGFREAALRERAEMPAVAPTASAAGAGSGSQSRQCRTRHPIWAAIRPAFILLAGVSILLMLINGPGNWIAQVWRDEAVLVSPLRFFGSFIAVMLYSVILSSFPALMLGALFLSVWRSALLLLKTVLVQSVFWSAIYAASILHVLYGGAGWSASISYSTLAAGIRPASETVLNASWLLLKESFGECTRLLSSKTPVFAEDTGGAAPAVLMMFCLYTLTIMTVLRGELCQSSPRRSFRLVIEALAFSAVCFLLNTIVLLVSARRFPDLQSVVLYLPVGPFTASISATALIAAVLSWLAAALFAAGWAAGAGRKEAPDR